MSYHYMNRLRFQPYDKETLLELIGQIEIIREGNQVITKFRDRVTAVSNVSNRYEVFDIKKYIQDKLELIENNFEIKEYHFTVVKGVQQLKLISDTIDINGVEFHKAFFIINSSDRSRRLQFHSGLYSKSDNYYMVSSTRNLGLSKKHYHGVTEAAENATKNIDGETFTEQIEAIKGLVGHKVSFSKLREVMLGDKEKTPKANHLKFDKLKQQMRWAMGKEINNNMATMFRKQSQYVTEVTQEQDFYMDAFMVFQVYLKLYSTQDSHIVKNETERILGITQWAVRNETLAGLLG
jgi:hypothetical protein